MLTEQLHLSTFEISKATRESILKMLSFSLQTVMGMDVWHSIDESSREIKFCVNEKQRKQFENLFSLMNLIDSEEKKCLIDNIGEFNDLLSHLVNFLVNFTLVEVTGQLEASEGFEEMLIDSMRVRVLFANLLPLICTSEEFLEYALNLGLPGVVSDDEIIKYGQRLLAKGVKRDGILFMQGANLLRLNAMQIDFDGEDFINPRYGPSQNHHTTHRSWRPR